MSAVTPRTPESYLRKAIKGFKIQSILDVGVGDSGVFDYGRWEQQDLEWKVCCDIHSIREDIRNWMKLLCDARYLPFRDDVFTLVQSTEMIEHIPSKDHSRVIAELKRVASEIVYLASSGRWAHRGELQKRAEAVNPHQKYQGIVDRELLIEENFKLLYDVETMRLNKVKAVYYKKKRGI